MESDKRSPEYLMSRENSAEHYASTAHLAHMFSAPDSEVVRHLLVLSAELENEFRSLEHKMDALEYRRLSHYREQHAHVLAALHRVVPIAMAGDLNIIRQLIGILPAYLQFHRQAVIQELAEMMKSRSSGCHVGAEDALCTMRGNCADFDAPCFPTYFH